MEIDRPGDRSRLGWWLLGLVVAATVLFVGYSFVGTFVLGLFVYYAVRPVNRRLENHLSSGLSAALTMVVVALPALLLGAYLVVIGLGQLSSLQGTPVAEYTKFLQPYLDVSQLQGGPVDALTVLRNRLSQSGVLQKVLNQGLGVLSTLSGGLLHVFLSLAFAFYLLRDEHDLAAWFRAEVGDRGTAQHAFLSAIDRDLHSVYFGNVLTVLLVAVVAVVVYNGLNAVAPAQLSIPLATALALATGLASFVPIVVGKLVYVPLGLYLAVQAFRTDPTLLWFPALFFVVSFVLLDMLPVMFLRPYLSGQSLHTGLVMFAYVLGTVLFGWYGLFFGPLVVVFVVQFINVVLPELFHGHSVGPETSSATNVGSVPADTATTSEPSDGADDTATTSDAADGASDAG
ncbi:AI-2E family transporter [Halococcus qingdaonensis]|uniref:AI-2E family transporter n=1 Tax=Halococcus qingdaonensis TaxID=224402 RepID=UPI0021161361|nr:AI-2E family transporter [Halococcus qingdaonensis]